MPIVTEADAARRPIAVIGGGTLGWQIAGYLAARGAEARLRDIAPAQAARAEREIAAALPLMAPVWDLAPELRLTTTTGPATNVADAWLVIEAKLERADLKTRVFGELDLLAPPDALLSTNSSSYKSSALIERVGRPTRVLNTHF